MLPPSFSFRLPMRMYIAPPLSPPGIKRKRPAPIPAKCYNTPHVGFPCDIQMLYGENDWRRRDHWKARDAKCLPTRY